MQEKDLNQLKSKLDIVQVAEKYGELVKSGSNYIYKNNKSISISPSKQIFSDFNGSITGGSVLDLIAYMENLDLKEAINRLKELAEGNDYKINPSLQLKRKKEAAKKKEVDYRALGLFAKNDLVSGQTKKPYQVVVDDKPLHLAVNSAYFKLYERETFPVEYEAKFDYLHQKIIGFDEFYRCPSIIIRDKFGKVIDKCAYRPNKPDHYEQWSNPKYIYKHQDNRPDSFLYPFQKEVETILNKEDYFIVGEGIKNAINALIYGVPFISTESTSNKPNTNLLNYIKELLNNKYRVIAMYDGDEAGAKGFESLKKELGVNIDNFFDFTSDDDFTSYISGENK